MFLKVGIHRSSENQSNRIDSKLIEKILHSFTQIKSKSISLKKTIRAQYSNALMCFEHYKPFLTTLKQSKFTQLMLILFLKTIVSVTDLTKLQSNRSSSLMDRLKVSLISGLPCFLWSLQSLSP